MNLVAKSEDLVDVATVDQQIEQHAHNVERIQREAIYEIGREFAAIQDLHRYKRDGDGFTDYVAKRFPSFPQRSVYQAINIYKGMDDEMFANFANFRPSAVAEIAKTEPDIQAIIAERVAAGEVFTAAQVKELKAKAARSAMVPITPLSEREREQGAGLARSADP